jgi:hypothetical protein
MAIETHKCLSRHKPICGFVEPIIKKLFNSRMISVFVAFVAFGTAIAQAIAQISVGPIVISQG